MPSFTLRSNRDIAIFVGTVALICNAFVGLAIEVYFPDEIADQILLFGFFCATVLAVPICYLIGIVMRRNAGLTDELARIVNRDRLTDAATRDYFFKQLDGQPDSYGISLMVDIDHFKKVNDTYGHLIGDHAIRHVCRVIKGCIRSTDIVCRFGGEEFVVFLDSLTRAEGEE
ncbi:MAG: GGDEF domain-containing protein, partial [Pseudomonadota bacterium]